MKVIVDKKNVQKLMFFKGMLMKDLAKEVGVSDGYLSNILNQKTKVSNRVAKKLADVLEVEVKDIFVIKNHKQEESV